MKSHSAQLTVAHVAEDMSVSAGGVPAVVRQLTKQLHTSDSRVIVLHAHGDAQDLASIADIRHAAPSGLGTAWAHGPGLAPAIDQVVADLRKQGGVCHVHGVWCAPQIMASARSAKAGVPSLLSAHGMLEPWLWNQQGTATFFKKKIFWQTIGYPNLRKLSVIHAITPIEQGNLAKLFPGKRIEVIPNAIDVPEDPGPSVPERKSILFLGRIDPKKGVHLLIHAFAAASLADDWHLNIAGPSWSDAYMARLKAMVIELKIEARVHFLGPLFGDAKTKLLTEAWVMVTPSYSEAIGLVNLEAAAFRLPSVTTHQTGLFDWCEGGGMLTTPDAHGIRSALKEACAWSDSERVERGEASRNLVVSRYSWPAVIPRWFNLYSNLK